MEGGPTESMDETPKAVIVGVVIALVIAAAVIGTAVFFVQRHYRIQSQQRRENTPRIGQGDHQQPTSQQYSHTSRYNTGVENGSGDTYNTESSGYVSNASNSALFQGGSAERTYVVNPTEECTYCTQLTRQIRGGKRTCVSVGNPGYVGNCNCSQLGEQRHPRTSIRSVNESVIYNPDTDNVNVVASSPQLFPHNNNNSQQQNKNNCKPCVLKCKCAWLKQKLAGKSQHENRLSRSMSQPVRHKHTEVSSPHFNLHEDTGGHNQVYNDLSQFVGGYPLSLVHCSSDSPPPPSSLDAKTDFNSNFYGPDLLSLDDEDFFYIQRVCNNNPAPSINLSNCSDDVSYRTQIPGGKSSSVIVDGSGSIILNKTIDGENQIQSHKNFLRNNAVKSHRSSCNNSLADSESYTTYKTNIQIPDSKPRMRDDSVDFDSVTGSIVGIKLPNKSSDKMSDSAPEVNVTIDARASNEEVCGNNRLSTSSWHSFSSDNTLNSSVINLS